MENTTITKKSTTGALKNKGKKLFGFAKRMAAEGGFLGSYAIGGRELVALKKLGSGQFSSVRLVRDIVSNEQFALKKTKSLVDSSAKDQVEREARLLSKITHPNIVKCVLWGRRQSNSKRNRIETFTLLELCKEGNLAAYITKNKGVLRPKDIVDCLFDVTDAINYLHNWQRIPISHRDIRLENLVLHKSGTWKLCDFGSMCCRNALIPKELSRQALSELHEEIEQKVTMLYRPPELVDLYLNVDDKDYNWPVGNSVDMWQLGCVTYALLFGDHPFKNSPSISTIRNAKYYIPNKHPNSGMKSLILLAQWLLSPKPDDRPTTEQLLTFLEDWQKEPDIFAQFSPETQERFENVWHVSGIQFTVKDRSFEGVFKKYRFQFEGKQEDLMKHKAESLAQGAEKTPAGGGEKALRASVKDPSVDNLIDFDETPPVNIVSRDDDEDDHDQGYQEINLLDMDDPPSGGNSPNSLSASENQSDVVRSSVGGPTPNPSSPSTPRECMAAQAAAQFPPYRPSASCATAVPVAPLPPPTPSSSSVAQPRDKTPLESGLRLSGSFLGGPLQPPGQVPVGAFGAPEGDDGFNGFAYFNAPSSPGKTVTDSPRTGSPKRFRVRLHLIRHAESLFNMEMKKKRNWINPQFAASGFEPNIRDPALSSTGVKQVEYRREYIRALGSPHLIIVSPLRRALMTAQAIWPEEKMKADPGIREITHTMSDCGSDVEVIKNDFPNVDFSECSDEWWLGPNTPSRPHYWNGEPGDDIDDRIRMWKRMLIELPEEIDNIFVVGHSMFFKRLTGESTKMDNVGVLTADVYSQDLSVTVITDHTENLREIDKDVDYNS